MRVGQIKLPKWAKCSCQTQMRPPTFPVAPSKIAEYCAFASAIVTSHARGTNNTRPCEHRLEYAVQLADAWVKDL